MQRWELSEGLPVHRLEHKQRASAYAFAAELDRWLANRAPEDRPGEGAPQESSGVVPARRSRWRFALLAAGLLILIVAAVVASRVVDRATPSTGGDTADAEAYAAFVEGRALYWSRRYQDAVVSLERAVTQDPEYGAAWAWLAKTYGRTAQPVWAGGSRASQRAAETANRAVRLAPGSADAHIALALAARARGDVAVLRSEARRASELDPRAAEALALLGDSYSAVMFAYSCNGDEDPELAESYYRQSMELMPNLTTTASNRAGNLRRMGRYAECVGMLNRAIRSFSDETPLLAVRGGCRLLSGDIDGATEDIAPLRDNPKIAHAGSLVYLGLLALMSGRIDEGIRDLEAITQFDQSARAELIVAEAYGLAGDVGRASAHLKRAFDLDAACPAMVERSLAFSTIRHTAPVHRLLVSHGVR